MPWCKSATVLDDDCCSGNAFMLSSKCRTPLLVLGLGYHPQLGSFITWTSCFAVYFFPFFLWVPQFPLPICEKCMLSGY